MEKYELRPLLKLSHEVEHARWIEDKGQWEIRVRNLVTGDESLDHADFLCYAVGFLSKPRWPNIPGRDRYKGIIHHSSGWDAREEEKNGSPYAGKRVGVIGVVSVVPCELTTRVPVLFKSCPRCRLAPRMWSTLFVHRVRVTTCVAEPSMAGWCLWGGHASKSRSGL